MNFEQDKIYKTIILAGLLHDIGKFLQRTETADLESKGKHPYVAVDFINTELYRNFFNKAFDFNLLETLIKKHHMANYPTDLLAQNAEENRAYALLLSKADQYSSAEREEKTDKFRPYKKVPLTSIFYKLKLPSTQNKEPNHINSPKHRIKRYKASEAFPEVFTELDEGEYNKIVNEFKNYFSEIVKTVDPDKPDLVYAYVYNLLLDFTWCVPSNTQEDEPDVSLFDHLKTTSAISACLYQFLKPKPEFSQLIANEDFQKDDSLISNNDEQRFALVMGDLSGIQSYIFSLAKVGAGAISKRLRARSFQLSLISQWASKLVLKEFSLPYANQIFASGGNFSVLVPNIDVDEKLKKLQKYLDEKLAERYSSEICFHLAWEPFAGKEFSTFADVIKKTRQKLHIKKLKPFNSYLIENNLWQEEHFVLPRVIEGEERICRICRKKAGEEKPDEQGTVVCEDCADDEKLGRKLISATAIAFYDDKDTGEFKILDGSYDLTTDSFETEKKPSLILSFSLPKYNIKYVCPIYPMFLANFVPRSDNDNFCDQCEVDKCETKPRQKNNILYFECLAQKAVGRKYLGMLKADVDHLGTLFSEGFKTNASISRIATFSRMLDLFFSCWVADTLKEKFQYIYTVFSGGDDLVLIGPWNNIIEFSLKLRNEFSRFTANNPDIHLSAGFITAPPHTPVNIMAESAEEQLKTAKEKNALGAEQGRNQFSLFGDIIKWENFKNALDEAKKLSDWINNEKISVSFARHLLYYSRMFLEFKKTEKTDYLMFIPLLTYDIARNLPPIDDEDQEKREARKWAENLKNQALELKGELIERLKFIATYAIMAKKRT